MAALRALRVAHAVDMVVATDGSAITSNHTSGAAAVFFHPSTLDANAEHELPPPLHTTISAARRPARSVLNVLPLQLLFRTSPARRSPNDHALSFLRRIRSRSFKPWEQARSRTTMRRYSKSGTYSTFLRASTPKFTSGSCSRTAACLLTRPPTKQQIKATTKTKAKSRCGSPTSSP